MREGKNAADRAAWYNDKLKEIEARPIWITADLLRRFAEARDRAKGRRAVDIDIERAREQSSIDIEIFLAEREAEEAAGEAELCALEVERHRQRAERWTRTATTHTTAQHARRRETWRTDARERQRIREIYQSSVTIKTVSRTNPSGVVTQHSVFRCTANHDHKDMFTAAVCEARRAEGEENIPR